MQQPDPSMGLTTASADDNAPSPMLEPILRDPLEHHRTADELEAESVKYNIARIVRLTSGAFALFTHHNQGSIGLIKVGTIEEIAPHIPLAADCALTVERRKPKPGNSADILADLGL